MDNFNLKKYLAENKLLKEEIDFPELEDEFEGVMDAMIVEPEVYLQDIIDASAEEIVSDDYYEIMNAVEQGVYSAEEAVELAKAWAKDKLSSLAENKLLKENTNPIWTINKFEDNADISDAGSEYKTAVINIIKAKHPDISSEDLEKSIEVTNDFWYDEARENSKGSDPEEIKVSAEDFADGAIEYYEDIIMYDGDKDEDSSPGYQSFDDYIKGEKEAGNY